MAKAKFLFIHMSTHAYRLCTHLLDDGSVSGKEFAQKWEDVSALKTHYANLKGSIY